MTPFGYLLVGLTAITAMLVGALTFALLRIVAGARDAKRHLREDSVDTALLSAALQDAVGKLKAQEQAMSARAAASDRLRGQIADSLAAGLLVVDGQGRVDVLNPAGRRLLELNAEPAGMTYQEALVTVPPLAAVISEFLASGEPIVRRTVNMPGTMKATHFGVTVSPLATGSNKTGAICLFADLTNVVELEEQLRLKETLARLGELTAGIAHEFRNGLATIHGYSRLLDPAMLPVQCRPYVEGIRQEAEVLGKVVTNFLDFARPQQLSFGRVDLGQIARRAVDDIKHELPTGTDVTVAGEFGHIDGDDLLLRQVFGNLLRNATEACEQHGVRPAIVIEGKLDPLHRSCRVVVEDNGPGIPVSEREKVFRPFVTTRSRGTGLGLAIVQKIVLTHRGRVSIGSSPAGGASVQITIQTS